MGGSSSKAKHKASGNCLKGGQANKRSSEDDWQSAPAALSAALVSTSAEPQPLVSLVLNATRLRGWNGASAGSMILLEASVLSPASPAHAHKLRSLLSDVAGGETCDPAPEARDGMQAAEFSNAVARCADHLRDSAQWSKSKSVTSPGHTLVDGLISWTFACAFPARPVADAILIVARDLRSAPGSPPVGTLVLLPEWFLTESGDSSTAPASSSSCVRVTPGAATWFAMGAGPGHKGTAPLPQLLVRVSIDAPAAPARAPSVITTPNSHQEESTTAQLKEASPAAGTAHTAAAAVAGASPESPVRPALKPMPPRTKKQQLSSAPVAAEGASTPSMLNVLSAVAHHQPVPPSAAASAAAAAAAAVSTGEHHGHAATAASSEPEVVVLPHAHTVYCDRKRQVCTAEGAVREGNRLGLSLPHWGITPAAGGSLSLLPRGTAVTWYRSPAPAAGYEALHAELQAHGGYEGLVMLTGGAKEPPSAAPRASQASGGGGDGSSSDLHVVSTATTVTATADAASIAPPASAEGTPVVAAGNSDSGSAESAPVASNGDIPPVASGEVPSIGAAVGATGEAVAATGTEATAAAALSFLPEGHPVSFTDDKLGVTLLPVTAGVRSLDSVFLVPAAPGIGDVTAPQPPPNPADPHADSPLFTSTAALRLLRSQALAALADPAQYYCSLGDVGYYVTAVVTVRAPSTGDASDSATTTTATTVTLPVLGPIEPAPPRFREVWVEVWAPLAPAVPAAEEEAKVPAPSVEASGTSADAPTAATGSSPTVMKWAPLPPGTAPRPGGALVARAVYYGGVPSAQCSFAWIRVDNEGNRTETEPMTSLPHAPLDVAAALASAPATGGPSAADPRVYRLGEGAAADGDVGCSFKVTAEPVRWDGERGAPTTSKPTLDVSA